MGWRPTGILLQVRTMGSSGGGGHSVRPSTHQRVNKRRRFPWPWLPSSTRIGARQSQSWLDKCTALFWCCIWPWDQGEPCHTWYKPRDICLRHNLQDWHNRGMGVGHCLPYVDIGAVSKDLFVFPDVCDLYAIREGGARQGHYLVYWARGKDNLADSFTKHHPTKHHHAIRGTYLVFTDDSSKQALY